MAVPYTFGSATSSIPLSYLDTNFATPITLGNTAVYLGNTTTSIGNLTLTNVTISSGSANITANVTYGNANAVVYTNTSNVGITSTALTFDGTTFAVGGYVTGEKITAYAASGNSKFLATSGSNQTYIGWDGSASASEIATNGDWRVRVGASYTEGMRLTSTGLGIGTSSPAYPLDVVASSGSVGISLRGRSSDNIGTFSFFTNNGVTNDAQIQMRPSDNELRFAALGARSQTFYTNGSERMRLDSSGNLGLGVTPSAWYTFTKAIQSNYVALTSQNVSGSAALLNNAYEDGNETYRYVTTNGAGMYRQTLGSHKFYTAPSGTAGDAISFTQAMTLNASGNLGIGTTSPINNGGFGGLSLNGTSGALLSLMTNGTETSRIAGVGNETSIQCAASTGFISFVSGVSGGTERARIDTSGKFLVGTTSGGSDKVRFASAGGSENQLGLLSTDNSDGNGFIQFRRADVTSIGSVSRVGTTNAVIYNTTSDYRLKNVIGPVFGHSSRIDALKPIDYQWKEDNSQARGFLAHEFQTVYPNSVTGEKDNLDANGNPKYQSMQAATSEVIADLVAEIQSLRKRLADAGI
jgi:hypothetical protein